MPEKSDASEKTHGEKEQMTEPQNEWISDEAVPSKDVSEVPPEKRKATPEPKS